MNLKKTMRIKLTNNKTHKTENCRYTLYSLDSFIPAYCHPAYLIFCNKDHAKCWLNELKARNQDLPGEILTSDMQRIPP